MTELVVVKSEMVKDSRNLSAKINAGLELIHIQRNSVCLLDVSSSMNEFVDGIRKIDHLRKAIEQNSQIKNIKKISFSHEIWEDYVPDPQSNTDMALGFKYLQNMKIRISSVILISDGLPDNQEWAIVEAMKLNVPVDVIYIGETGDLGESFMRRLAALTGGKIFITQTNKLERNEELKMKYLY